LQSPSHNFHLHASTEDDNFVISKAT
jgi:hypothetical protein